MNADPLPAWPAVSVVMPVLNEARHLRSAVGHVLAQDYPGEIEAVIALGPSTDETDAIAAELAAADPRVRTVPNPTGGTPHGLNAAVAATRYGIIARVDGHGIIPPDYIRTAVTLLNQIGADNVGGIMDAEGTSPFERAVACAMKSSLGVGSARFHTGGQAGPSDTVYLGVFRRTTLEKLGGYDESFHRAQDWELNYRIRRAGGLVWFSPDMRVAYRPRPTVGALARQYFNYGRWRRVITRQHRGSANFRYLTPPAALLAVAGGTVLALLGWWAGLPGWPVGLVAPAGYITGILFGAAWVGRGLDRAALVRLPVVLATMHGAWGAGFLTSPRRLGGAGASATMTTPGVGRAR
jgi:glycosyltransferase involved in cell wall biosynthesis